MTAKAWLLGAALAVSGRFRGGPGAGGAAPPGNDRVHRDDRLSRLRRARFRPRGGLRRSDRGGGFRRNRPGLRQGARRRHVDAHRIDQQGLLRGRALRHGREGRAGADRPARRPHRARRADPEPRRARHPADRPRDPGLRPAARGPQAPMPPTIPSAATPPRRRRRGSPAIRCCSRPGPGRSIPTGASTCSARRSPIPAASPTPTCSGSGSSPPPA